MKKIVIFALTLVLALSLSACGLGGALFGREYTFPKDTVVLGIDMSGATKEEAWTQLETAAGSYTLNLTVDGTVVSVSARDIDLTCSRDAFMAGADAMEAKADADFSDVVSYDETKLRTLLESHFCKEATEASLAFDEATGAFVLTPHAEGLKTDMDALTAAVRDAVRTLAPQCSLSGLSEVLAPVHSADTPEAQAALELVNKMTGIQLSYSFEPTGTVLEIPAGRGWLHPHHFAGGCGCLCGGAE